jgi:chromosome segregation ATPase
VTVLLRDAQELVGQLERELGRATKEVLESATAVQATIRERAEALGHSAGEMATGLSEAVNRLRAVEPPPLTLARRLDKVSHALETAGTQVERVAASLQATVQTADAATAGMATASATLQNLSSEMKASHVDTIQRIGLAVETVTAGLNAVGGRLEHERRLLEQLEEQSRRSAEESARAQAAAVEVLSRLTELTRGLTSTLKDERRTSG